MGSCVARRTASTISGPIVMFGHEAPVHDVDVDPVGAGRLDGLDLLGEPAEVGGEDGGGDADGQGGGRHRPATLDWVRDSRSPSVSLIAPRPQFEPNLSPVPGRWRPPTGPGGRRRSRRRRGGPGG